jgi:nicotinate-nucleotide adenylyltransferase
LSVRPIGILGGTFDPIHFGHLRAAFELNELLDLESVLFVPAADPPHRGRPLADAVTRLEMVLEELRLAHGARPLVLMLGMDAFLGLATWHRWRELLDLAHLAVAHRPGAWPPVEGELGELLSARRVFRAAELAGAPAGCIFVHPGTQLDISSTDLRDALRAGKDPRYLMPEPVRRMIIAKGIYARQGETSG